MAINCFARFFQIIANFSDSFGEFSLTQKFHPRDVHEGFEVLNIGRTLSYPRIDLLSREGGAYYWKFPEEFCGDKVRLEIAVAILSVIFTLIDFYLKDSLSGLLFTNSIQNQNLQNRIFLTGCFLCLFFT